MCLQCDGWSAAEVERHINNLIEQHGWAFQYVEDPNPRRCFGYTMGLTKLGEPEFLVRGLDMADTNTMFTGFVSSVIDRHEHFDNGHTSNWVDGRLLYFSTMHGATKYALGAYARYGHGTRVLEIHFMDREVPPATPALMYKTVSAPAGYGPIPGRKS
ncbi:DUF4262 domain-containing protein [Paeniglutamicibacter psychrophenolicus]|uniref:DUF4262 domain-containing protein n=1 Tax=Paeniglutamicibacter psychrophenolicus TaxID=257454 RepID=UPI002780EF21|nr:DUF4262 domain-containing protein [Paeniglutamicibacter psychrophenolicus]MDQ0093340.1 hypothetical protein [Paeniglutamicibacter psychrophenolicus]